MNREVWCMLCCTGLWHCALTVPFCTVQGYGTVHSRYHLVLYRVMALYTHGAILYLQGYGTVHSRCHLVLTGLWHCALTVPSCTYRVMALCTHGAMLYCTGLWHCALAVPYCTVQDYGTVHSQCHLLLYRVMTPCTRGAIFYCTGLWHCALAVPSCTVQGYGTVHSRWHKLMTPRLSGHTHIRYSEYTDRDWRGQNVVTAG